MPERPALRHAFEPGSLRWEQLEPGRFAAWHDVIYADPMKLTLRRFNLGFKGEARLAAHKFMLGLTANIRTQARWFGAPVRDDAIVVTRTSVDVRTEGQASFYQLTVDEETLARLFPNTPDAMALIENVQSVALTRHLARAHRLRCFLRRIFSMGHDVPKKAVSGTLIPMLAATLEDLNGRVVEVSKCLNRRLAAVRICEEYMREHVDETVTLLDLSDVSCMRSRSLINAFEAVTGFSPMDYLKRLRLNGVRRALEHGGKHTRIIDVATESGFWHMGHFTTDYRAMFGETPSHTLLSA